MRVPSARQFSALLIILSLILVFGIGLAVQRIVAAPPAGSSGPANGAGLPRPLGTLPPSPVTTGVPSPVGTSPPSPVTTATPPPIPTPPPPPQQEPRSRADVCVSLLLDPDGVVPPGGVFTYTLVLKNSSAGDAVDTGVRIALDPNVEVRDFKAGGAYVDYLGADAVSVRFGDLSRNAVYTAQIIAQVRASAPAGAAIVSRAEVSWADGPGRGGKVSNAVRLAVGPRADSGAHGLLQRLAGSSDTAVAAGAVVALSGDFFGGEEPVSFWVNRPDRSVSAVQTVGRTDRAGLLRFGADTTGWAAGTYSVVAHGLCTGMEGLGVIVVR